MSIRRLLLLSFLLVGLLPAVVLTGLAFTQSRDALRAEIEQGLAVQAHTLSAELDKMLFERMQNVATWNHLDVMQDLRVGDVDRRVSAFLFEMKLRYGGVYLELHASDAQDRIVASSAPGSLGQSAPAAGESREATLPGGVLRVSMPQTRADGRRVLAVRSTILSQFDDAPLGELVALMDWSAVERMLDAAAQARRMLLVLDADGRVLAASAALRGKIADGLQLDAGWLDTAAQRDAAPLAQGQVILAQALAPGYDQFSGFGWTTLVLQPAGEALRPVRRMGTVFLGLLLAATVLLVLLAGLVSGRIARPIAALTDYTRRLRLDQHTHGTPPGASGEVGELSQAFAQMVQDLDQSRQNLVRASKLAAVGEFAAVMAHEIRTPLGILRSSAQMLERDPSLGAESRELAGFIGSETQRLNRLVNTLLDQARAREPQRSAQDVQALIERSLAMLEQQARKQSVVFIREYAAAYPVTEVDGEQMMQVFLNLLMNALQILPDGGRVTLRTRDEPEHLLIEVADSGPGVPESERERIFEPFVFHREGGVGLGLAVVRQIVRAHGGDIVALNNPGGGACFRLRLPRKVQDR